METGALSKKCLNLWLTVVWVWFTIAVVAGVGLGLIIKADTNSVLALILIPAGVLVIALLTQAYVRGFWKKFKFSYDCRELRVNSGIWWQNQALIPVSRITNIDLTQGPWQRSRKLATLKIQTAGQSQNQTAEASLYSQENYEQLRENLLRLVSTNNQVPVEDGTAEFPTTIRPTEEMPWQRIVEILERIDHNTRSVER